MQSMPLADLLPFAVGIALSPLPIVAVILMLFSERAKANGIAFVVGWIAGLAVVGAAVLVFGSATGTAEEPSQASLVVQLLLGLLLIAASFRQWRASRAETAPEMPKWMKAIDAFSAAKAFAVGALLSGINPKNLALNAAAMIAIAQAGLSAEQQWVTFAVFVILSSLTVALPVLYYLVGGESSKATLTSMKAWLMANNAIVMAVLLLLFGLKLLGAGIQGLLGL